MSAAPDHHSGRSPYFLLAASLFLVSLMAGPVTVLGSVTATTTEPTGSFGVGASLGRVEILPETTLIEVGHAEAFHAFAYYDDGTPVMNGELVWQWELVETSAPGVGELRQDDLCEGPNMAEFAMTQVDGTAVVKVTVQLGSETGSALASVTVSREPSPGEETTSPSGSDPRATAASLEGSLPLPIGLTALAVWVLVTAAFARACRRRRVVGR